MKAYDTVTEAINDLKNRGFSMDFNLAFDKIICRDNGSCLNPSEFEITEVHRFEGETNPSDEDVVYAVSSHNGKLKGTFTSAYGMYAESLNSEMINKLTIHRHSPDL